MSNGHITIIGMDEFAKGLGFSIFDKMVMPNGINIQTLIDSIKIDCGEFEAVYTSPEFLRDAIGVWCHKMYGTFEKWSNTLELSKTFNPLENYDRTEEWETKNTGTVTNVNSSTNNSTSGSTGNITNNGQSNAIDKKSAFNSDEMRDDTSTSGTSSNTTVSTDSVTASGSTSGQDTQTNDLTELRKGRAHGNIGVTSLATLWSEYDKAAKDLNIYSQISDLFVQEFTLMIY